MSGSITAKTQSTKLKPLQTHTFTIQFNEMEPCPLVFKLSNYDSGTITQEGLYTAPNRSGTFEIRIFCADNPDINTYAYVDVQE